MSKIIKIDHSNVKKLEGSRDYPLWKINLENIFWASGLDQVVFGKEKRPSSDADKQRAWDILNRAGMGIILQTVDEKLTSYVCSSDTAEKMWSKLLESPANGPSTNCCRNFINPVWAREPPQNW